MKILAATTIVATLAVASSAFAIEPIPGSITYGGHVSVLEKSPVGSNFFHTFFGPDGKEARETYRVNSDHTVSLVARSESNNS